jgi:hypothetical protein
MLSSNVRLVQDSANQLSVLIPPFYGFGLGFFFAAPFVLFLAYRIRRATLSMRLTMGLTGLYMLLLGFYTSTSSILMVLSRSHDTLSITHRAFGLEISSKVYPLHDVAGFGLYTSKPYRGSDVSHDISVLLKSGREFGLAGATTNQGGYSSAVDALNDFLRERSPVQ